MLLHCIRVVLCYNFVDYLHGGMKEERRRKNARSLSMATKRCNMCRVCAHTYTFIRTHAKDYVLPKRLLYVFLLLFVLCLSSKKKKEKKSVLSRCYSFIWFNRDVHVCVSYYRDWVCFKFHVVWRCRFWIALYKYDTTVACIYILCFVNGEPTRGKVKIILLLPIYFYTYSYVYTHTHTHTYTRTSGGLDFVLNYCRLFFIFGYM